MRLPSESALSREQKEVIGAPAEGTILVLGPPGSGKTVVAIMRERALRKQRQHVTSVVYTNVLTKYTGNDSTFHTWIKDWWREATGSALPGRWESDPSGQRRWQQDHLQAANLAAGAQRGSIKERGNWQHLIIDEAQDFPPEAHRFLSQVQHKAFSDLPEDERPSICLLADENQRITGSQSTVTRIRSSHPFLSEENEYLLERNYRNSRPIAEFAAHFYVGLPSGVPELPTRTGDKPRVLVANLDQSVERIATYAKARPNEEIGVLVYYKRTAKKIYNKLAHRLRNRITVQMYLSGSDEHGDASKLVFDNPGVVTILCFASAKGLEFDAVFLPELQTMPLEGVERDHVRMNLYVMCSRARQQLWLMIDDPMRQHEMWKLLPPRSLYEVTPL